MRKPFSILVGLVLILIGGTALAFNIMMPQWVETVFWRWGAWQLWPLFIVGIGLLFVLSPFLVRGRRGLGGLFIPGMPILITGGILLFNSVFDAWGAWEWLWPLEVLAVAAGFLFAAIYMRAIWLLLPAIVVGANGLVFLFCALTDLWELWAALWAIEPLSLGLAFLVINVKKRSAGLFVAGLVLCGVAAIVLMGMSALFPGWVLINLVGPVILILIGLLVIVGNVFRRPLQPEPVEIEAEPPVLEMDMADLEPEGSETANERDLAQSVA
jgi:hypothetical protein